MFTCDDNNDILTLPLINRGYKKMNKTLQERKSELEKELEKIKKEEIRKADEEIKKDNFKKFKNRCTDWIIGKAHAQFTLSDNGWHDRKGERAFPESVHISGSCGDIYIPYAQITSATNTYFHNVIPDSYRREYLNKLIDVTHDLLSKILNNPVCVLEIMSLQSNYWNSEKFFLPEDLEKVKEEIERSQDEILDKFPIKELRKIKHLSRGNYILSRYLQKHKKTNKRG